MYKTIPKTLVALLCSIAAYTVVSAQTETSGGWHKYSNNPVLGGDLGTIFDISVLKTGNGSFRMYCSWRPQHCIALSESKDGLHWSKPVICLENNLASGWESEVNRPVVIYHNNTYYMWYTGQNDSASYIGYATSKDGRHFTRQQEKPVLTPTAPWEKKAVMCPHVLWNSATKQYTMWYSGGEQYEPDAIGYATSTDGIHWAKHASNPVFANDTGRQWEQAKVTACQVIKRANDYLMFYIGFKNEDEAQIGMARSKDGICNWERYAQNPIVKPGKGWDSSAVYKPYAVLSGNQWLLYYNGRRNNVEQIGIAIHPGKDLDF